MKKSAGNRDRRKPSAQQLPLPLRLDEWKRCLFEVLEAVRFGSKSLWDDAYRELEAQYEFYSTGAELLELFTYSMRSPRDRIDDQRIRRCYAKPLSRTS